MIKDYSREIIDLRRRSNALLPISQLPESVLAEIFDCYRNLYQDSTRRLTILHITRVCHFWRAIASSYGNLWADIYPVCAEQVRHWLKHSAKCPLDLETRIFDGRKEDDFEDPRSSSESEALRLALEELPSIRTLSLYHVWFTKEQLSAARWTRFPASLPMLQSLHVEASTESYAKDVDNSFSITALFLLRDLPSLTHLTIFDDRLLWKNMRFPKSLKHLDIAINDFMATWNPDTGSVILCVLDTLPSLESLKLTWAYDPDETIVIPAVNRQVTLSRLQRLLLHAYTEPNISTYFLDSLAFPSATTIDLLGNHDYQLKRISLMLEGIARKLDGQGLLGDRRSLRTFSMQCDNSKHGYTLMGRRDIASASDGPINTKVDFSIYEETDDTSCGEVICMICNTLPLSEARFLLLQDICLELQPETFVAISHNMPALHRLCIHGWNRKDSDSLPACLFGRMSGNIKGLFPKLRVIQLQDLRNYSETIGFWDFFAEFLASRKEGGTPVEGLVLVACDGVGRHHLKLMRALVDVFIWRPTRG